MPTACVLALQIIISKNKEHVLSEKTMQAHYGVNIVTGFSEVSRQGSGRVGMYSLGLCGLPRVHKAEDRCASTAWVRVGCPVCTRWAQLGANGAARQYAHKGSPGLAGLASCEHAWPTYGRPHRCTCARGCGMQVITSADKDIQAFLATVQETWDRVWQGVYQADPAGEYRGHCCSCPLVARGVPWGHAEGQTISWRQESLRNL